MVTANQTVTIFLLDVIETEKFFSSDYNKTVKMLDEMLRIKESFDLVGRDLKIDKRNARLYFVDGFFSVIAIN